MSAPISRSSLPAAATPPTSPRHLLSLLHAFEQAQKFAAAVTEQNWLQANLLLGELTDDQKDQFVNELSKIENLGTRLIYFHNYPQYLESPLLHVAVRGEHEQIVKILIAADPASTNAINRSGETPLHVAACRRNKHVVQALLAANPASVNIKDQNGWTPLQIAAWHGEIEMVRILLATNPSLGVLEVAHRFALQRKHNATLNLIQHSINERLLACGLAAARTDAAPSSLRTFVCNRNYEPRVMKLVREFL